MLIFRSAKKEEISVCTDILKSAFKGYSFFEVFVDNPARREKFFNEMMDVWMKTSFKNEIVLVAELDKKIIGVSVIATPESKETSTWDYILSGGIRVILAGGLKNTIDFMKMSEISDEICHNLPNPKWHLSLLAISDTCKGKGIGSKMLKDYIIPFVKEHGCKLFTFNTNEENNRRFYIRNGFEEFHEMTLYENDKTLGNWSYKLEF